MAIVLKDRVKQSAAAPGTGTITLGAIAAGFQAFSAIGNGNVTYFAIVDPVSGAWEVNYGTYTSSGTTLSRNATPLSSSAAGALVNFTGAVDVFCTYPSEKAVWQDTSGVVAQQSFGAITATSAALTTGTITATPVNNTDIVNKEYADAIASGIHFHEAVALATTAALPANTYNNGTSGVGATLTGNANGALSVDSTLTIAAERILVKNEVAGANNGVYVVTQVGSAGTPYILTRATDFDSVGTGVDQIDEGDFFLVTSGVANLNTAWVQQTAPPITIGTTAIVFQQFSAPITYTAGTGLSESPTYTFNIANTGTAGTYGSASQVPVFVTNAQGQVTSVTNTAIAISGSAVSGAITGQAGSVANALTAGTHLTSTGSFDGSAARTFAVDAVSTNTASKVVARDASGDFAAGTITAALAGNATTSTTATNVAGGAANQIVYNTASGTTTFVTAPTTGSTFLGWTGSAFAWTAFATPNSATFNNSGSGDASGTSFDGSVARTISYNTVGASPLAGSTSITTLGTITTGVWNGTAIGSAYGGMVYPGAGIPVSTGSAWTTSKASPSGVIVGTTDTQTLTNKQWQAYNETVTTVGTVSTTTYNIDLSLSNIFDITLGNNVTFTFTNPPASGISRNCTVILRQDATGNRLATFTNAKYTDGTAPILSTGANQIDVLTFFTLNGGSFWFGTFAMANVS
jgi:hypothetical protein